ncbi:hypothetical protein HBI06_218850 [Parastagonospora nodorum]|nr:hypothetical protein HBI06_218850 [Parastagonospora nodorum]KAH4228764.1 hypothetical protein HBI05_201840 [Parastagonospora nodorum]
MLSSHIHLAIDCTKIKMHFINQLANSSKAPPTTHNPLNKITPQIDSAHLRHVAMGDCLNQADILEQKLKHDATQFDPEKHIAFSTAPEFLTMKEIGYADDVGISPVAVTHPFPLFTPEAIQIMRSEIAKPEVSSEHHYASNIASSQLRGYARRHAPFTYAAWNHPRTIGLVSKLAGIDLIPWSDYEIAHINLSATKTEEQAQTELAHYSRKSSIHSDEGIDVSSPEDDKPIVGWHTDSYPFVCVLMMSDCTNMVGGETALRIADGRVIRVRGPTEGCAVILQGRYITHQAVRALGAKERITAVTSWRPKSPFVKDDSVLRTVRPVSDLKELYMDFAEYRLEIMEQRIRREREQLRARREAGVKFGTQGHKAFLQESAAFLAHTDDELVADEDVEKGFVEEMDVPNVAAHGPA